MGSDAGHETQSIPLFLHGLDSSIEGTKAQWFRRHFPGVRLQNYTGELDERLAQLEAQVAGLERLVLVGSSFGGLMAACFALRSPERCRRLVLLAPALNFVDFHPPAAPIAVPTLVVTGAHDTVCPPALSEMSAGVRFTISSRPSVSTATWRLRPTIRLPPS